MKGSILDFSIQNGQGLITTEEGRRYTFAAAEWKEQSYPVKGQAVDFDVNEAGAAVGVYAALGAGPQGTFAAGKQIKAVLAGVDAKSRSAYNPFDWYLLSLKNYANFKGRAQRKEYWFYMLFYMIGVFVFSIIDEFLFNASYSGLQIFSTIFTLGSLVPSLAVAARRLHDLGKSGWWQLLAFIPLVGIIILIIWYATKGQDTENAYGQPVV